MRRDGCERVRRRRSEHLQAQWPGYSAGTALALTFEEIGITRDALKRSSTARCHECGATRHPWAAGASHRAAQNGPLTYPPRIPKLLSETVDNRMRSENEERVCEERRGSRMEWQQDTG